MRRRLGRRLAGMVAIATGLAVLAFATPISVILWGREVDTRRETATVRTYDKTPAREVLDEIGLSLVIAAPVVVLLATATTRRLTRRVTDRLDELIEAAQKMTHERLSERLPVSTFGDELDTLATALNGLFARLDEGLAAQTQFVADASHELRTPLAVLRSELEIARRRPRSPGEWEAVADRAYAEVVRMTSMVEALLRLARTGAAPPTAERIDARALVDGVVAGWQPAAAAASVTLVVDPDEDAAVEGDADALAVAVGNLVGNAIAHSPAGGTVTVAARRAGAAVEISVSDQGPGVPQADRERIFLPFSRGSTAADRDDADGGVGLGLSVARRIVEAHRGELSVDDAPGGGARFRVWLTAA